MNQHPHYGLDRRDIAVRVIAKDSACSVTADTTNLSVYWLEYRVNDEASTGSLLAYVNKAKFWVDSWHPYLFISKNCTDQEKNGCQFFH